MCDHFLFERGGFRSTRVQLYEASEVRSQRNLPGEKIEIFKIKSLKIVRVVDLTIKNVSKQFFKQNTRTGVQ